MLPRSSEATVESAKVRDYLLSTSHPLGRFKAAVFFGLGYTPDDWPRLRDDLKSHAASSNVELDGAGAFGQKYVVTGPLTGPSLRFPHIFFTRPGPGSVVAARFHSARSIPVTRRPIRAMAEARGAAIRA